MNQRESSVISVLRYPLAVLVIMCHSSLFTLLDKVHLPGSESWNVLNGLQVFFSETIIHVAVPLFMLFSGMLFFRKGLPNSAGYAKTLKKKVRTLLVPYLIWSTFCFFTAVADGLVSPTPLHWLQGLWDTALWQPGTTFNINLPGYPMSMPLWFLRDLMILMHSRRLSAGCSARRMDGSSFCPPSGGSRLTPSSSASEPTAYSISPLEPGSLSAITVCSAGSTATVYSLISLQ